MTQPKIRWHQLPWRERLAKLRDEGIITEQQYAAFKIKGAYCQAVGEHLVENYVTTLSVPVGIIPRFYLDQGERSLLLATEESSIIAGINKMNQWVHTSGGTVTTTCSEPETIGQILWHDVKSEQIIAALEQHQGQWIKTLHQGLLQRLHQRGGGIRKITVTRVEAMRGVKVHIHLNPCDAMGANYVTQAAQWLATQISQCTGQQALMSIVSNYNLEALTTAKVVIPGVSEAVGGKIATAAQWAQHDVHRACTHNKGIMNGIDALLLASGNDTRAVEAACHAYGAQQGSYQPLTSWSYHEGVLVGQLQAPLHVACRGGATQAHPDCRSHLEVMGIDRSSDLARLAAAVGLLQNLAALHALTGEGIVKGHMTLHIENLLLAHQLTPAQQAKYRPLLKERLQTQGFVTSADLDDIKSSS